jgi:hypothetical protein
MRKVVVAGLAACGVLIVAVTASRSGPSPTVPTAPAEPILGAPAVTAPGSESPRRDPFAPYDIGPAAGAAQYADLPGAEKAVADRGRDTTTWRPIHDGFTAASGERARGAAGDAAQLQLGIEGLAAIGVVP